MTRDRKPDLFLWHRLYTTETRVTLRTLPRAETFVMVIDAQWGRGLDAAHPWHEPVRRGNAPCVTAPFSP